MTIVLIFQIGNVKGAEETVKTAKALDVREESHIVEYTVYGIVLGRVADPNPHGSALKSRFGSSRGSQ
jgi:hypothetical protein